MLLLAGSAGFLLSGNSLAAGPPPTVGPPAVQAREGWKAEFDAVCSKTDVAMTLSVGELKELIARCVELKGRIEAQEETIRKVYLRRLQMCGDLYKYVLEEKEKGR
jgi:hypothetical protein